MFGLRSAQSRAITVVALAVMLLATVVAVAVWRVNDTRDRYDRLEHTSAAASALEHARAQTFLAATWVATSAFADDPAAFHDLYQQSALASRQAVDQAQAALVAIGAKEELAALEDLAGQMDELTQELDTLWASSLTANGDARIETAQREMIRLWPLSNAVIGNLEQLAAEHESRLRADVAEGDRASNTTFWLTIALGTLGFVTVACAGALVLSVVRPLAALRASARAITAGELGAMASVAGPEEVASLAHDFNEMTNALAAKAQEYIDTTNLTGVLVLRVDEDNRVSFVNDAMCEFLGRSREEILGTPILDYLHPQDAPSTIQRICKMVQSKGLVTGIVTRHVTPTGTRVTEWSGYPIFDEDGRYAGVHGTGRDITERKRAEEALRESEEKYRRLVEDSINGIVVAEGAKITFANRAILEALGYQSEEEVVGRPFTDFVSPEYRRLMLQRGRARDNGQETPGRYEFKAVRKDGSEFDAELSIGRVTYQGKTLTQAMVRDISERKRAEEALRESERRYRLLAENVTDVIWAMDTGLRFTYISPSVTQLRGYTVEQAMAQTLEECLTPASLDLAMKAVMDQRAIEQMGEKSLHRALTLELEQTCRDGSTVWTEVGMAFLRDEDNRAVGIVGIARDITERKRAEQALRESEERFRQVAETAREWIWEVDTEGRYTYCSPAVKEILGYEPEEVIGRSFYGLVDPEEKGQLLVRNREIRARKVTFLHALARLVHKDGHMVVIESAGLPILDLEGNVIGYRGVNHDISERKRAEEALRESEERLRAQYKGMPIPTYTWRRVEEDFVLVDYNDAAEAITRGAIADFLRVRAREMYRDRPEILEEFQRCFTEKISIRREMPYQLESTGESKHFAVTYAFVPSDLILVHTEDISERKRAEEALRESEQRYRAIFEQAADSIALVDAETGALVHFNDRAHQTLGYTREEFEKLKVPDFEIIESAEEVAKHTEKVIKEGADIFETKHRTKSGEIRDIEVRDRALSIRGKDFIQAIFHDITERKRAEEALRESERRYRLLAENVTDVIWIMDTNLRFTYVSPSVTQLRGYTVEEAMAQTLPEFLTPASLEVAMKALAAEQAIEESETKDLSRSRTLELEQTCKDGSTVWTEVKMAFLRDEDDRPVGIVGVGRDVTERKRAEEALRESEVRLRILFEFAPDAYFLHDLGGAFLDGNKAAEELVGYKREELIGKNFLESGLLPLSEAPIVAANVAKWAQGLPSGPDEVTLNRKDGSQVTAEVRTFPVTIGGEGLVLGIARDVTERKRAEKALRESEEKYRRLVQDSIDGIVVAEGPKIELANRAALEMLGYASEEEALGRPFTDFVSPKYRDLMAQRGYARDRGEHAPARYEFKALRKDGSEFDAELSIGRITYQGRVLRQAVVRDISERKRAEEAIRESEEKFRNIFQNASDGIVYLDTSGTILDVNEKAVELFGGPREEVLGKHFTEVGVFRRTDMPTLMTNFAGILSGKKPNVEVGIKDRKGHERLLDCSGSSLKGDGRVPDVVVVAVRDITERKRAEKALRRVREDIESRVERRVQEVNGYRLTFRELTVLHLVAAGKADKEIATVLGISRLTAHKHLANILDKMGAVSRTEAGVRALREGLLN